MRTDNLEVSYTVTIPFNMPDKNGVVYSRSAIEDALQHTQEGLPIRFRSNDDSYGPRLIGYTTSTPYAVQFDDERQLCKYCIDGRIFLEALNVLLKNPMMELLKA